MFLQKQKRAKCAECNKADAEWFSELSNTSSEDHIRDEVFTAAHNACAERDKALTNWHKAYTELNKVGTYKKLAVEQDKVYAKDQYKAEHDRLMTECNKVVVEWMMADIGALEMVLRPVIFYVMCAVSVMCLKFTNVRVAERRNYTSMIQHLLMHVFYVHLFEALAGFLLVIGVHG